LCYVGLRPTDLMQSAQGAHRLLRECSREQAAKKHKITEMILVHLCKFTTYILYTNLGIMQELLIELSMLSTKNELYEMRISVC